jgi:signal transduction histidine kinase
MSVPEDTSFARLVSLACHDLRTPLATVQGFAVTLTRLEDVGDQAARYLGIIDAASRQLAGLLDELGLAARIESGRFDPALREADTLELARAAVAPLEAQAAVAGRGARLETDPDTVERALHGLARCALRHGALERVELRVNAAEVEIAPIMPSAAPVITAEELRDLGAAVAGRAIEALGGSLSLRAETLHVRLAG